MNEGGRKEGREGEREGRKERGKGGREKEGREGERREVLLKQACYRAVTQWFVVYSIKLNQD